MNFGLPYKLQHDTRKNAFQLYRNFTFLVQIIIELEQDFKNLELRFCLTLKFIDCLNSVNFKTRGLIFYMQA